MISLYSIYGEPNLNKSKEDLIGSIKSLTSPVPAFQEKLDVCIKITEEYLSHANYSTSADISIKHALRVTLLMLSENILNKSTEDAIFAVLMHDLFEVDKNFTYNEAKKIFGSSTADILLAYKRKKYFFNELTLSIFVFEKIDKLLSSNNLTNNAYKRLINKTQKAVFEILKQKNAEKLLLYFKDALFFANQNLNDNDKNKYLIIDNRLKQLKAFQSAENSFAKIQKVFKNDLFDIKLELPSIYQIYKHLNKKNISTFCPSDILYDVYLIAFDTYTTPSFAYIIQSIITNQNMINFSIEKLTELGFLLTDDLNNHYQFYIMDFSKYRHFQFGDDLQNEYFCNDYDKHNNKIPINVIIQSSYDSKTSPSKRTLMPRYSTIIDYLLTYGYNYCKNVTSVIMNDEVVKFEKELNKNSIIKLILNKEKTNEIPIEWLIHCQTMDARKKMYDIISSKIKSLEDGHKSINVNYKRAVAEIEALKKKIEQYENELSR